MIASSRPVEVVTGWDPPLQSYFATVRVAEVSGESGAGEIIYSKIANPESPELDLEALRAIGIELPQVLLRNLSQDAKDNVGNLLYEYLTKDDKVLFTVSG